MSARRRVLAAGGVVLMTLAVIAVLPVVVLWASLVDVGCHDDDFDAEELR